MGNKVRKRIIFFDLDGTLHKQDMFSYFLFYLIKHLPLNIFLVIIMLPLIIIGFIIRGFAACLPMNLLLWSITFGRKEDNLQHLKINFVKWFRKIIIYFPIVQNKLYSYLSDKNTDIWIVTGSPDILVKEIYSHLIKETQIHIISSIIYRNYGGWILSLRCSGNEKILQLKNRIGNFIKLDNGYSDNFFDKTLLFLCKESWLVNKYGKLKKLN